VDGRSGRSLLADARGELPLGAREMVLVGRRLLHSRQLRKCIVSGTHEVASAVRNTVSIVEY
jgi:hypothetical protein